MPRGTTRQGLLLAILALGSYVIIAIRFMSANDLPRDDQLDYLRVAAEIRSMGGSSELWLRLWNGTYTESNRHPLYPAMLSIRPDFTTAKWLSFCLGLFPLAMTWWLTKRRAGWLV